MPFVRAQGEQPPIIGPLTATEEGILQSGRTEAESEIISELMPLIKLLGQSSLNGEVYGLVLPNQARDDNDTQIRYIRLDDVDRGTVVLPHAVDSKRLPNPELVKARFLKDAQYLTDKNDRVELVTFRTALQEAISRTDPWGSNMTLKAETDSSAPIAQSKQRAQSLAGGNMLQALQLVLEAGATENPMLTDQALKLLFEINPGSTALSQLAMEIEGIHARYISDDTMAYEHQLQQFHDAVKETLRSLPNSQNYVDPMDRAMKQLVLAYGAGLTVRVPPYSDRYFRHLNSSLEATTA